MLPILFLLMLPSLIFGTDGLDNASGEVLNDTSLIMENIAETENSIETILREKHDALLEEIQAEADALGSNCEYSVTDLSLQTAHLREQHDYFPVLCLAG